MKYYLVLFKYADKWHIDVFTRDEPLEEGSEEAKRYTIEAARFAIERLGLKKDGNDIIESAQLSLLTPEQNFSTGISVVARPVHAVDSIEIL